MGKDTKFCRNCGKELPIEATFCPYCMTKFDLGNKEKNKKKLPLKKLLIICVSAVLAVALVTTGVVVVITSGNAKANDDVTAPSTVQVQTTASPQESVSPTAQTAETNSGIDNEIGLRNTKVDSERITTDEQKTVAQYFDNDYIDITKYEFLARYPSIFENAQICFTGTVQKIIKSTDTDYEILVWVGKNEANYYYRNANMNVPYDEYKESTKDNLIIIKGKQTDARLVIGDEIVCYGRYTKIDTQSIDGTSYTIPTVNVYRTFFNKAIGSPNKFDDTFVKQVAKALFGNDIEVRNAKDGEDYDSTQGAMNCNFTDYPFMICEPENQSNAKFTKYRFYLKQGIIEDAKSKSSVCHTGTDTDNTEIIRKIEFAPDFQHYLIYTFDTSLNSMSVAYYDSDFKKIWQRDFEETVNGVYDYTKSKFYIVANNDLYIIDMQTGEDVTKPSYVGEKTDIRKVADGLIMFSAEKSDSVMKTDLDGNIVWKTNIMNDNYSGSSNTVQFVDDKIIVANNFVSFELNAKTGELVTTGELVN